MNDKGQGVLLVCLSGVLIFLIVFSILLISMELVSDEDVRFCEVNGGEQNKSWVGKNIPGCEIFSCNKAFNGITYCETKMFKIKNNKFIYEDDY